MARKIDTDAVIDKVRLKQQFSHPAAADSGYNWLYVVSGSAHGGLYLEDSGGRKIGPFITGTSSSASGIPSDGWVEAGETWTYASADDPSFAFTIAGDLTGKYQPGQRIKLTQTTAKYFIVTKVAESGGTTTITVYGGTDYDLANAAISNNYYSPVQSPFGFPSDPTKWEVKVTDTSIRSQSSPVQNTWYNLGSVTISIPIGAWRVSYKVTTQFVDSVSAPVTVATTLSNANNSESDLEFTQRMFFSEGTGQAWPIFVEKPLVLTSKTSYFLNTRTTDINVDTIYNRGDVATTILRAVCAYL